MGPTARRCHRGAPKWLVTAGISMVVALATFAAARFPAFVGSAAEHRPQPVARRAAGGYGSMVGAAAMPTAAAVAAAAAGTAAARREVRVQLLTSAAATCRGRCGSPAARDGALQLVQALEALNPTAQPANELGLLEGQWRLIFASEDVTRSSPFFWGWRRMLKGVPDPFPVTRSLLKTDTLSESVFAITDGIPMKTIGEATQALIAGKLVNRVTVEVFGFGQTVMTTTCRYMSTKDPSELALTIETTQAVGSSLPLADSVVFPSEAHGCSCQWAQGLGSGLPRWSGSATTRVKRSL